MVVADTPICRAMSAAIAPVGTVTLGMTTFNRPDYAVANARSIAASTDLREVLHEMLIVDQGTQLVQDEPDYDQAMTEIKLMQFDEDIKRVLMKAWDVPVWDEQRAQKELSQAIRQFLVEESAL